MAQTEQKNDYRSERKERLAKNAKKKNKKNIDSTTVVRNIIIAICAIAVVAALIGGLYAYGVPQKILPAVKVEDRTYSVAEYSYYYTSVYQTYANQSYSTYQDYGISLGFDYQKDPAAQTTKDEDGNEITYAEFFKNYVIETLENYNYYLKLAKAENMVLSDESKAEIDATINDLANYASTYGYSADRYVSVLYGKGLNVKKLRSLLEEQYLVSQYVAAQTEKDASEITLDDINARYDEDPQAYQAVDLRLFGLEIKDETDNTEEAETTEAVSEEITEENTEENTTSEEVTSEAETTEEVTADENETTAEEETSAEEATEEKEPSKQELLANEMLSKITDEDSFVKLAEEYCAEDDKEIFKDDSATLAIGIVKSTVSEKIDKDLAEWLFAEDRQVGDKTVAVTDDYVYVIMIKNTAYRNETPLVSARHILISYDSVAAQLESEDTDTTVETADVDTTEEETTEAVTDDTAEAVTDDTQDNEADDAAVAEAEAEGINLENDSYSAEVILEAHKQAVAILDEYKAGEMTEDAFAALAEKYSADTASVGESGKGGLYENIAKGQMVSEFENWVYDASRKPGDTGIIQTTYGWHIMYFVKSNEEAPWIESIRALIAGEKETAREAEVKEIISGTAESAAFEDFAAKSALKLINKLYTSNNG